MTEQEYTHLRDLLRDNIRHTRDELKQLERELQELEQGWKNVKAC